MDCPAEERLIRLAFADRPEIESITCDLDAREVRVVHRGPVATVTDRLRALRLGAELLETDAVPPPDGVHSGPGPGDAGARAERAVLIWLLLINGTMFVLELGVGLFARSAGLVADSLDMLADAAVYGLALLAVGRPAQAQRRAARLSGWFQGVLAAGVVVEVVRRAVFGSEPVAPLMMAMASLALLANVACLALLARHRHGAVHMRASWIFSTNDVLANLGVILAGVLVAWSGSNLPDLAIGLLIAMLVLYGAWRILRLP